MSVITAVGSSDDGHVNAPSGAPQTPNLLSGYAVRPPWQVAGVDYAVGPRSAPMQDPATISLVGVTVNSTTHTVTIAGDNVALSGYDFNGWSLIVTGSNAKISDCTFELGTNNSPYIISGDGANLTVQYCTLD